MFVYVLMTMSSHFSRPQLWWGGIVHTHSSLNIVSLLRFFFFLLGPTDLLCSAKSNPVQPCAQESCLSFFKLSGLGTIILTPEDIIMIEMFGLCLHSQSESVRLSFTIVFSHHFFSNNMYWVLNLQFMPLADSSIQSKATIQ